MFNSHPGGGGGATTPLPRDEGVEELYGDPTVELSTSSRWCFLG